MITPQSILAILTSAEAGEFTTLDELRGRIGCTRREVEEAVQSLRLAGHPIVGGNEGLRYTQDPTELAVYLESRRRRTAEVHRGTMKMRTTLRRMREATDLTLWGTT